ncbi:exocyst complex component 3-like 2 [Crotalus adamanteus]|uniref:Exocyst complex component 3-like 2 n=1 Tax=Crotalus adamanteus TaxID=8729 RepID=A0AAW1AXN0_CROAD
MEWELPPPTAPFSEGLETRKGHLGASPLLSGAAPFPRRLRHPVWGISPRRRAGKRKRPLLAQPDPRPSEAAGRKALSCDDDEDGREANWPGYSTPSLWSPLDTDPWYTGKVRASVAAFFHLGAHGHRAPLGPSLPEGGGGTPPPCPASGSLPACVPRSVLEILNLIHRRELRLADGHIMELEAECAQGGSGASGKDGSRKAKDVALLYEALQEALWAVLAEALAAKSAYPPLEQLVQVIEQEEEADRSWRQAQGGSAGSPGPRQMRQRWAEAVDRLAGQKLCQCVEGRAGTIATRMDRLAKCTVEDLSSVKRHLLQAYPEEYQAFSVYLGSYHRGLARCLAEGVQKQLSLSELYFVLDWNSNIYQREVLSRPEISPMVKPQELGPLLSPETQQSLEEECIAAVKVAIGRDMSQELQKEEERWAQEDKENSFQFGLSSKVILVLKGHADKAPQITEEFGRRVAHCCLVSLAEFLQSFQKKVEKFHEGQVVSSLSPESYVGRTIMLVNCCPPFRDYLEHLARFGHPDSEAVKHLAGSSLDRVTRLCNRVLADHLFQSLKPYFYKLMKRKWLNNSEAFSAIMALLAEHAQRLRQMKLEPYQMLVREVHRRVLIEYVRPLMRVRIICTSSKMRAKVAHRLRSEAKQLQEFFIQLESSSSWLDSVVPHLAGILELEDTPAIQMEVAFLARAFPDVQFGAVGLLILGVALLLSLDPEEAVLWPLALQPRKTCHVSAPLVNLLPKSWSPEWTPEAPLYSSLGPSRELALAQARVRPVPHAVLWLCWLRARILLCIKETAAPLSIGIWERDVPSGDPLLGSRTVTSTSQDRRLGSYKYPSLPGSAHTALLGYQPGCDASTPFKLPWLGDLEERRGAPKYREGEPCYQPRSVATGLGGASEMEGVPRAKPDSLKGASFWLCCSWGPNEHSGPRLPFPFLSTPSQQCLSLMCRKKHLAALLDIRGLQSQAQRQLILAVLETLELTGAERDVCQDRAFFSEISTSEVFCVRLQLHRLSHFGLACLSRVRRRPPRLQRQRRGPREKGAEAQL